MWAGSENGQEGGLFLVSEVPLWGGPAGCALSRDLVDRRWAARTACLALPSIKTA